MPEFLFGFCNLYIQIRTYNIIERIQGTCIKLVLCRTPILFQILKFLKPKQLYWDNKKYKLDSLQKFLLFGLT